jgi:hypothetical protein
MLQETLLLEIVLNAPTSLVERGSFCQESHPNLKCTSIRDLHASFIKASEVDLTYDSRQKAALCDVFDSTRVVRWVLDCLAVTLGCKNSRRCEREARLIFSHSTANATTQRVNLTSSLSLSL